MADRSSGDGRSWAGYEQGDGDPGSPLCLAISRA